MIDSLARSWELVGQSWRVLRQDRELMIFPVLSGAGVLLAGVSFFVPLHLFGFFASVTSGSAAVGFNAYLFGYLALFLFYFVDVAIVIFFNAALAGAVMKRLEGSDPTVEDGLRIAWSHRNSILAYAAIAGTVGVLLRMLKRRGGLIARSLSTFGGLAWAVATYLVVPVLVVEGIGPIDAIKRSAHLLRQTWGQQVAGGLGFGVLKVVAALALAAVTVPLIALSVGTGQVPVIVLVAATAVLLWATSFIVLSTLESIYRVSLYHYAATGKTGSGIDAKLLEGAFGGR